MGIALTFHEGAERERDHSLEDRSTLQGHEKLDTPLDVLDALEACAAKGAARALCALAATSFRAATLLGMTCEEAAGLGPRQSLQVLLMKGPQAAPVSSPHARAVCWSWQYL